VRFAAPLSRALKASWISDELILAEMGIRMSSQEKLALESSIIENLNNLHVDILKEYKCSQEESGNLLTWKLSYYASILDSKRTRITYEVS